MIEQQFSSISVRTEKNPNRSPHHLTCILILATNYMYGGPWASFNIKDSYHTKAHGISEVAHFYGKIIPLRDV